MENLADHINAALTGRYRLEAQLGAGGMALVFRALDLRHGRTIALKVLKPELTSALGNERFLREIQLTARLDHPHIIPLLDSGEADEFLYYAMPLVEGQSLRDRLDREKQLPIDDVVQLTREVAGALAYAHDRGVVHRDIKPENILLSAGIARVADFGIARAVAAAGTERLTETGLAIGTPTYMSPEQATGQEVDGRTDTYSLGCVVYEMLVGEPPFSGPTPQASLARKLQDPVPSVRRVRPTVPTAVEAVVEKALATVPADRYATPTEFAQALVRATTTTESPALGLAVRRRWRRLGVTAGVATLTIVAGWWGAGQLAGPSSRIESLVVLPLDNLTGDSTQAYFVDGMHEALTAELSRIRALKVISRTSAIRYRGSSKPAPQIARELGVEGLVEGSVARDGDRVRITVQLIHAPSDRHVWTNQFDRELRGILDLHTEVAQAIAAEIKIELTPQEQVRLAAKRPVNPRAFEFYLLGRHQFNGRSLEQVRQSVESFGRALEFDPNYAPAQAGMANTYLWLAEQGEMPQRDGCVLAEAAIEAAVQRDESSAEAHVARAVWQLKCAWNWNAGEREFRRALELEPGSSLAHQYYGRNLSLMTRRHDEALAELHRARELDPLSIPIRAYIAQHYLVTGQFDLAARDLRAALDIVPDHPLVLHNLGELALAQRQWRDAIPYLEQSLERQEGQSAHYLAILGIAYARDGRRTEAADIERDLEQRAAKGLVSAFDMASLHVAIGSEGTALDWLERGYAQRDFWLPEMLAWPWFEDLRPHARYQEVVGRMKLPW